MAAYCGRDRSHADIVDRLGVDTSGQRILVVGGNGNLGWFTGVSEDFCSLFGRDVIDKKTAAPFETSHPRRSWKEFNMPREMWQFGLWERGRLKQIVVRRIIQSPLELLEHRF